MKVSEAMTPAVLTVTRDTPLTDAARLMRDSDVGPLPVSHDGRVVGLLTDRDITVRAIACGKNPQSTRVEEVMTPLVVCCLDTDDLERAAELMQSAQLGRLLVVSGDGRLAGIVSLGDLALKTGDDTLAGDPLETLLRLLNQALATEIVSELRYKRHYYVASGIHAQGVAAEFLEHANEEQAHAGLIAARIMQLGGEPDFSPDGLTERSHSGYAEGACLVDMIHEDLIAERVAIDSYSQMIRFLGDRDSTTRVMLGAILAADEERAEDLANLLVTLVTREG